MSPCSGARKYPRDDFRSRSAPNRRSTMRYAVALLMPSQPDKSPTLLGTKGSGSKGARVGGSRAENGSLVGLEKNEMAFSCVSEMSDCQAIDGKARNAATNGIVRGVACTVV